MSELRGHLGWSWRTLTRALGVLGLGMLFIIGLGLVLGARAEAPAGRLQIRVNQEENWVDGQTSAGATVWITLTDSAGSLRGLATAGVGGDGWFKAVNLQDAGQFLDIVPGDRVLATSSDGASASATVLTMTGSVDVVADAVRGRVQGGVFPATIRAEVQDKAGSYTAAGATDAAGHYVVSLLPYDLRKGQRLFVWYEEFDGDQIGIARSPFTIDVNYGHDWVETQYEAGHRIWITLTDSSGQVKATNSGMTGLVPWWGGRSGFSTNVAAWLPSNPDLLPGDWVYAALDDGSTSSVRIGAITGNLDINRDLITGTISAPWFTQTLNCSCNVMARNGPGVEFGADPNGGSYTCDLGAQGWDLLPGQNVAVYYRQPEGEQVLSVFSVPAPYLHINRWGPQNNPGVGGNLRLLLEYNNDGDAPAEDVVITATLSGLTYLTDTATYAHTGAGGGPIVWRVGDLPAHSSRRVYIFVAVDAPAGAGVSAQVQLSTSNPYDQSAPEQRSSTWNGTVSPNDTRVNVSKGAWTGDPAPGYDLVYTINLCSGGSTASSRILLTDTLPPLMTLRDWWSQDAGWTLVRSSGQELVFSYPSLSNCSLLYLRVHLDAIAQPGTELRNTVVISASNDLDEGNNQATYQHQVGQPRRDLALDKSWNSGTLVPGGQLRYGLYYGNRGNLPIAGPIRITDTFPISTTLREAQGYQGPLPVTLITATARYAVWQLDGLENGFSGGFQVVLDVAGDARPGALLTNTAEISPQPGEEGILNNTAIRVERLNPRGANLRVRQDTWWQGQGGIQYSVRFENTGDQTSAPVWLTITLPAATTWGGWVKASFDNSRVVTSNLSSHLLFWELSNLAPGEASIVDFNVQLDQPGARPRWYTNTVVIAPRQDANPADNTSTSMAFSGGELERVELGLDPQGSNNLWGSAIPNVPVTVTTPVGQFNTWSDGKGGWSVNNVGALRPGDTVTACAGQALLPVVIRIPNPFSVNVDTKAFAVWGQIGGWANRSIEVHGNWPSGNQVVGTDALGRFRATYASLPRTADGSVRYVTEVSSTPVIFHHGFVSAALLLRVNSTHGWVETHYEPGHTLWLTVTDSLGAVRATMTGHTAVRPEWGGGSGFNSGWGNWQPGRPDFLPGDWVYGSLDNGETSSVRIGAITGQVDASRDIVSGTITAVWFTSTLPARCEVWAKDAPYGIQFTVAPAGGAYLCDWGAAGWDVQPGLNLATTYVEPDGDQVVAVFSAPAPDLQVDKWSVGQVAAGSAMIFDVRYANHGDVAAQATLTDTLPLSTTYVTDTSGRPVTVRQGQVIWDLGSVLPGAEVQFQVVLRNSAPPGSTLRNQVDIGAPGEANLEDNHAEAEVTVSVGQPDLWVTKNPAPGDPTPGQLFDYQISYGNQGHVASGPVRLTDTLPLSTTVVAWRSENGYALWRVQPAPAGQWALYAPAVPDYWGDRIILTLRLNAGAPYGAQLANHVTITTSTDSDPRNNSHTDEGAWVSPPRYDVWSGSDWGHGTLAPGGEVAFRLNYGNGGNSIAPQVRLTATLPAGSTFVASVLDLGKTEAPFPPTRIVANQVVWELGNLPVNASQPFMLRLRINPDVAPGSVLSVCSAIATSAFERDPYNNAQCVSETVQPAGPNLRVTKSGRWERANQATYDVAISNLGTTTAYNVTITDTFPVSATLSSWRLDHGSMWSGVPSGSGLALSLGRLPPNATAYLRMWLDVPAWPGGVLFTNTARVDILPGEVNPADNRAVLVMGTGPDLAVSKRLSGGAAEPGGLLTYTLHAENRPQAWGTAGNVWLSDTLPAGLTFVTATLRNCWWFGYYCPLTPAYQSGGTVAWRLGQWGPGDWNDVLLTVRVQESVLDGTTLTNTATLLSDNPAADVEADWSNNRSTCAVTVSNPLRRVLLPLILRRYGN